MLRKLDIKALPKKLLPLTLFAIAVTSLFSVRPAQAVPFTITLQQVGSNVVATGSGAINLSGLTFLGSGIGSGSSTYNNSTFASLGVTPGTYVWSWGTGANQNFTLIIGGGFPMAARQFLCSVALCSAWLPCGAN